MKKWYFAVAMMFLVGAASAGDKSVAASTASVNGKVLEVKDGGGFTYLRLTTKDGETWAAIAKTPVKVGSEVTIENVTIMQNFESKTLKQTFDRIVFGSLVAGTTGAAPAGDMAALHAGVTSSSDSGDVKVAKASGPNARTVAEIATRRTELKDKAVVVRGKVVKFTPGVLGKNWIHLRDGSGSTSDGTNDVVVTTSDEAKIGDIVLVKGVVHIDRDLGSGYSFKVLIDDATLHN